LRQLKRNLNCDKKFLISVDRHDLPADLNHANFDSEKQFLIVSAGTEKNRSNTEMWLNNSKNKIALATKKVARAHEYWGG